MTKKEELDWLCRLRSSIYMYMPKEWLIPMNNALDMAIKTLEQELKIGHWEREIISLPLSDSSKECYKCSNCNTHWEYAFKHCPNCGIKMKSED